ncbi:MAG: 2-amino-4-hydroxy-6-hydroxymethyldihydropteridine diphosphokinase [Chitinophagales bacterium]|nr:2-amino-4-hydroxy-6-hydroxymethyldihydropteridine diphosphokinase [Chitinophagales bacterium]
MHQAYLLFGSNLDDRESHINHGLDKLRLNNIKILKASSIYETSPWGVINQPDYLNVAVKIATNLSSVELFGIVKEFEREEGRINLQKYAPRELDIDILFYDEIIFENNELIIPHPKIQLRKFTLIPMNEIASAYVHPVLKKSIKNLLLECEDIGTVRLYKPVSAENKR